MGEIIYVCKSINNKNVRQGELQILRKAKEALCFEFGPNEMNIKKRFYENQEDFEDDFNALMKIKENGKKTEIKEEKEVKEEKVEDDGEERFENYKRKSERPRRNPYSRKYDDEY